MLEEEKKSLEIIDTQAWESYQKQLNDSSADKWDYIIITASNAQQAIYFDKQLKLRQEKGLIPSLTVFHVVPDPPNERVGNGGAMLGAMAYVASHASTVDFKNLKILVILSSGDSKRAPMYSPIGKIFSPVPRVLPNGNPSTLFDEIMIYMAAVPSKINEGMLVVSGDVMLVFDANMIDYSSDKSLAMAFKEPVSMGKNHGVFLSNTQGNIAKVWHKQTEEFLRDNGAVDTLNQVNIDTGAVIFSPSMVASLYKLICDENGNCTEASFRKYVNNHLALSMYVDFFYPLAEDSTFEGYLKEVPEGKMSPELLEARKLLWTLLRGHKIKLQSFTPASFIHFGSTTDVLKLMISDTSSYDYLSWKHQIASNVKDKTVPCYLSTIAGDVEVSSKCYIEKSTIGKGCKIQGSCILSCINIESTVIPEGVLMHSLKLTNGSYVCRILGLSDNPKQSYENSLTLFGEELETFINKGLIDINDLWDEADERILWNARLYCECSTEKEAIDEALKLYQMVKESKIDLVKTWKQAKRQSLNSSFCNADGTAL